MTAPSGIPYLTIYVVWHPSFKSGSDIAAKIQSRFRRNLLVDVGGSNSISVLLRTSEDPAQVPLKINFSDSEATAVVALIDENLAQSDFWVSYLQDAVAQTSSQRLTKLVFPVAINEEAYRTGKPLEDINFIRWHTWVGDTDENEARLLYELTYQFCRMLKQILANPSGHGQLAAYLERVRIFLSHSKHDEYGAAIATEIQRTISSQTDLTAFFDVLNIPPGLRFSDVLMANIELSAVIAIHTDSFSSREWCRREILEAKRHGVPLVVANAIVDFEERGFPYMGNVPVVRLEPDAKHRISTVVARLIDEVFRSLLWKCRIRSARERAGEGIEFLGRAPELVSVITLLEGLSEPPSVIVYPDPPLGEEELNLFEKVAQGSEFRSFTEWAAEA